uniref:Uncharacterized protein n=1 Tax=Sphaerodactylus townsendi TaxID=933632 RepID=A0ACB8EWH7_9SAUR
MRRVVTILQDFSDHDVVQFILRPQIIARTLAGIFSLTVFASLVNEGYQNLVTSSELHCVLNENDAACCYGITVGALSFFLSLVFLGLDAFDSIVTSHKFKYAILVLDVTFSSKRSYFLPDP